MRYRKLPLQIRRRVQDYYEHRYHHKLFDEDAILRELSDPLRKVGWEISKLLCFGVQHYIREKTTRVI